MMDMTRPTTRFARAGAAAALVALAAGCGLENQPAPELTGPSEFALSLTLTATPDVLLQNGEALSVISVVARDPSGRPVPGVTLDFTGSASDQSAVRLTETRSVTSAAGVATIGLIAPAAPAVAPSEDVVVTVSARPVGDNFANAVPRNVLVRLQPPPGTLPANNPPVPAFTIVPAVAVVNQSVAFDASGTTDDGAICGGRCSYQWNFGDFMTGSGQQTTHAYTLPGTYTVTLTVVDDRGGVASTNRTVTVSGPAAPVANFTVTPASPTAGAAATFNASTSTVGAGATITNYLWDFGDGSPQVSTAVAAVTKTYAAVGTFIVTLTITDSLGRTATRTVSVTVVP